MRLLAVLSVVLLTAACGSDGEPSATPTLQRPAGVTAAEEEAFLAEWHQGRQDTPEAKQREAALLQLAYAICDDLASGTPYNDVLDKAIEYGADPMVFGPLVATVVATLCPEHDPSGPGVPTAPPSG